MPEYPTGRPRSPHYEANLEEFMSARALALTVQCTQCREPVGSPCRNEVSGELLKRFPAHLPRLRAVVKQEATK